MRTGASSPLVASTRLLAVCVVLASCAALSACAGPRLVPVLGGGPGRPGDPHILGDAAGAVQVLGYQPRALDAEHGSFYVTARSDRSGLTRFTVQCFSDGFVSILPSGGAVTREGDALRLPPRIHQEYLRLAASIAASIEVRR